MDNSQPQGSIVLGSARQENPYTSATTHQNRPNSDEIRAIKLELQPSAPNQDVSIPTFGNVPHSPTRVSNREGETKSEEVKGSEVFVARHEERKTSDTLSLPKNFTSKRPSKLFVRNFSAIYPPEFSDLESKQIDSSPVMLKEYKYRRMDSGSSSFVDDQSNNQGKEIKNLNSLSIFALKALEAAAQYNSQTGSSDSLQQLNSLKSMTKIPTHGRREQRFKTTVSNGAKTHETKSVASRTIIMTESSDDDDTYTTERMRIRRTFKKALYAMYFIGIMFSLRNRVQIYGALRPIQYLQDFEAKKSAEKKTKSFPVLPTSRFSLVWMFVLVTLMILNAILTPVYVSFIEDNDQVFYYLNLIFDIGFGFDILVNFCTAYYDKEGQLVTQFSKIILNYCRGWFWLDMAAILPFDDILFAVLQDYSITTNGLNKLLRLLKFPRLYRMLQILRLVKVLRLFSGNHGFTKILKMLNLNISLMKILKIFINMIFLNHIIGCLWFFVARLDDFNPETWAARAGLIDKDVGAQYIASIYWVFQTFTSVGYGDIVPRTRIEKIICALWPIASVTVYSFLIGNVGDLLSHFDMRAKALTTRIQAFERFSSHVRLPDFLRQKVKRFFEINHKENICHWADPNDFIKDLPANLKTSLLLFSYYGLTNNIKLLQVNANFTAALLVHLKLLRLKDKEFLYREDDPPHEVYFISKGAIKFVTDTAQGIFSLAEGTYFGEMEILEKSKRRCFCQAMGSVVLLVCPREIFLKIVMEYPEMEAQIQKIAQMRRSKLEEKLSELKRGETTERERLGREYMPSRYPKLTEYIHTIVLETRKERNHDDVTELGIKMDEEERKEYLQKKKKGSLTIPSFLEQLGHSPRSTSQNRRSLVDRLKALKIRPREKSKTPKHEPRTHLREHEFKSLVNENLTANTQTQSSTSLLKTVNSGDHYTTGNTDFDTSQNNQKKIDATTLGHLEDIVRTTTKSLSSPQGSQTTHMDELNLVGFKVQMKSKSQNQESSSRKGDSSRNGSRIILYEKGGSFFNNDLSSIIKEKPSKETYLPKSNKIAPLIQSNKAKEGEFIQLKGGTGFHLSMEETEYGDRKKIVNKSTC